MTTLRLSEQGFFFGQFLLGVVILDGQFSPEVYVGSALVSPSGICRYWRLTTGSSSMSFYGSSLAVEGIVGGSDQLAPSLSWRCGCASKSSLNGRSQDGAGGRSTQLLRKAQANTLKGHFELI